MSADGGGARLSWSVQSGASLESDNGRLPCMRSPKHDLQVDDCFGPHTIPVNKSRQAWANQAVLHTYVCSMSAWTRSMTALRATRSARARAGD